MIIARDAERAAKQKLLALMREDERFTDAAIKAALISGGYSEKSAENMATAYRALIEGRSSTRGRRPTPAPGRASTAR